jgi:thiol-disulfide isomerase/thioredoxin
MWLPKLLLTLLISAAGTLAFAGEIRPYSQEQFDALSASGKPVVIAVHASWCPTCKAQRPILEALMAQPAYRTVTTLTIDFDGDKSLLAHYRVALQSTLIGFKAGKEVGRTVGDTTPSGIESLVKKTAG